MNQRPGTGRCIRMYGTRAKRARAATLLVPLLSLKR